MGEGQAMVFDFLRRKDAPAAVERKASAAGRVVAWGSSGRVAWSARDAVSLTRTGYQGNPVGFRAVNLIAEAAAALPLVLQDAGRRYEVHPLLSLVSRPNPAQGRAEMLEAVYGFLMLNGNAYIEAVPGPGAVPGELHVLRSDRMALVPGADGWPVAYDYTVGNRAHRFDMTGVTKPVCHLKAFHPLDDHYGLSPFQAAAAAVDVHNAASAWSKALLDNAARPSGAIVVKGSDGQGSLSEEQYDRLVAEMEAHHQGARNAGRPMLLEGGLDWKPMGFSPSDMEFQKTKEAAAREIAMAFGVPPMMLGVPGDATYANYAEANRAFYRLTVIPLAQKVMADLSHWFRGFTGEDVEFRVDLDQVPALSSEREAAWARIVAADFLTEGEKRSLLGLPARVDG
jgi:HK97 family phage portal protein